MENQLPTYTQLFRLAWRQYLLRFDIILWSVMLFGLPWFILMDFTSPAFPTDPNLDDISYVVAYLSQPLTWINVAIGFLGDAVLVMSSLMIVATLFQTFQRKDVSWKEVFQMARHLYWKGLAVTVVVSVLTAIGFGFFIIPGVVIAVFLNFSLPALVWENTSVWGALRMSWSVVKSRWWVTFTYIVSTQLLVGLVTITLTSILPDSLGFRTVSLFFSAIVNSFSLVFYILLFTALYTVDLVSAPNATKPQE